MPTLSQLPSFTGVGVATENIWFHLSDGRTVITPLAWSKPLQNATLAQRQAFKVSAYNVFWDEIDEIIGVENVLYGQKLVL